MAAIVNPQVTTGWFGLDGLEIDDQNACQPLGHALDTFTASLNVIVTFVFVKCPDGPFGSFNLAQARIGCRTGVRPRGYAIRSIIEGAKADVRRMEEVLDNLDRSRRTYLAQMRTLIARQLSEVEASDSEVVASTLRGAGSNSSGSNKE